MYHEIMGSNDVKRVMLDLEADAEERGIPFTLCCIPEDMIAEFEAVLPGYYMISDYIDGADYIYDVSKMATLSGKKLQSKRNFVNRFKKTYEGRWSYEPITDENKQ